MSITTALIVAATKATTPPPIAFPLSNDPPVGIALVSTPATVTIVPALTIQKTYILNDITTQIIPTTTATTEINIPLNLTSPLVKIAFRKTAKDKTAKTISKTR